MMRLNTGGRAKASVWILLAILVFLFLARAFFPGLWYLLPGTAIDVDYVFDDDFHGIAKIMSQQPDGIRVPFVNGRYRFVFPHSGILKVKGDDPRIAAGQWHFLRKSGRTIPDVRSMSDLRSGIVSVVYLWDTSQNTSVLFVGSKEDADRTPWPPDG